MQLLKIVSKGTTCQQGNKYSKFCKRFSIATSLNEIKLEFINKYY